MKVYLSGPIKDCTEREAEIWREEAVSVLENAGKQTFSPLRHGTHRERNPSPAEIVGQNTVDIEVCDVLMAFCPFPSMGTSMEILLAYQAGKTVAVCCPNSTPSPWIVYHSDRVFTSLDQTARFVASLTEDEDGNVLQPF